MYRENRMIDRVGLVTAVEQAADGIVIKDTNGRIRYVNPAFTTMTGYSSEDVVGQNPRVLGSGHQSAAVYEDLWSTVQAGRVWHGKLINRRKVGTSYNEEMQITPVHDSIGDIVSYIAIKRDVTERLRSERAFHDAQELAQSTLGVEAVKNGRYDLVLMDCEMLVMDGPEATRRIRGLMQTDIPIIALTASAMSANRERCQSEGMNDFLSKPAELGRLAEVLAKWLPVSLAGDSTLPSEQPADEQPKAIFDSVALLGRVMADRQLAGIGLNGFVKDVPSQLDKLRRCLKEADASGTQSQIHTFKGSAATVGAERLHAIALVMEAGGTAGQLDSCGKLLPRAIDEFALLKITLERDRWV